MISAFAEAVPLIKEIENAGFEAYFVGGSVRDFLLMKPISDVDIATSATPLEIKGIFPKTVDVGIEHGTILVLFKGRTYEITTFRTDGDYKDFRRPEGVTFVRSLQEDLKRRDFTMNAIAMDMDGNIIDPFHGQQALKDKVIKTVGSPEERFQEDALRMMRALRFNSQLGFSVEASTFQALVQKSFLLTKIAVERKLMEFEKLLIGTNQAQALSLLIEAEVYKYLPGFEDKQEGLQLFSKLIKPGLKLEEAWVLLIYCFNHDSPLIETFLRSWKLPIKKIKTIIRLHSWLVFRLENDWSPYELYLAKAEYVNSTEKLISIIKNTDQKKIAELNNCFQNLPIKDKTDLAVSGGDLIAWSGKPGGPWVKELLGIIEKAVVEGALENNEDKIREWLNQCNQK